MVQKYNIWFNLQNFYDFFYSFMNRIFAKYLLILLFNTINELVMYSFGKKLKECREAKSLSQSQLAKLLNTNHSIIGKYERDEVKPTVDVIKRLAEELGTTAGFLLGESEDMNLLKDPSMLIRLNELEKMNDEDKSHILHVLDGFIKSVRFKNIAAL